MTTTTRTPAGAGAGVDLARLRQALGAAAAELALEGDPEEAQVYGSVEEALPSTDGAWVALPLRGEVDGVVVAALGEPCLAELVEEDGTVPRVVSALSAVVSALGAAAGEAASGEGFDQLDVDAAGAVVAVGLRQDGERVASLVLVARPAAEPEAAVFPSLDPPAAAPSPAVAPPRALGTGPGGGPVALALIRGVEMQVTAELGRTTMTVRELLQLGPGSVIELDRAAGSPVDLLVNGTLIARGEVVVIDEEYGIRVSEIVDPAEEG